MTAHDPHGHPAPYTGPAEHLDEHGRRLLLMLKHYVLRYWRRLVDSSGTLSDVYVSVHEALHALGATTPELDLPDAAGGDPAVMAERLGRIEADLARWDTHIARRLEASLGASLPLEDLRAVCRLDAADVDVVLALARMQSDLDFSRLCTFAWADFSRKQPDVAFVADLLSVPASRRPAVMKALRPDGVLARRRLLALHDPGEWVPETPHFYQRVALPQGVVDYLAGGAAALRREGLHHGLRPEGPGLEALRLPAEVVRAAQEAWEGLRRAGESWAGLLLWGPAGVGRKSLAAALGQRERRPTLVLDLGGLLDGPPDALERAVVAGLQEGMFRDAVVVVDLGSGIGEPGAYEGRHVIDALSAGLRTWVGRLVFVAAQPQPWLAELSTLAAVGLPFTSAGDQLATWEEALAAAGAPDPAALAREYTSRFNLTAGHIRRAVSESSAVKRAGRPGAGRGGAAALDEAAIRAAVRRLTGHRLGDLATPVHTRLGWEDLVLPEATLSGLQQVRRTMEHREQVFDVWGFSRIAAGQRGVRVLFSGPPGTGKTLAASVIGRDLARDVYRIDLSRIVDKYIGETEKNLGRLFDEAEHAQVLLLFDEADSLFAGRTSVQSVHDRYANVQTNYLLQRIESFEGVCVLTTNYEENIDDAFKRRLHAVVRFPAPDAAARALLWQAMMPEEARVEADPGWEELAREFEFAGGHIRNCVLRAAFAAAEAQVAIGRRHLREAAVAEARQLGLTVRDVPSSPRRR